MSISKSLPGRTWRKMSAAFALIVSRMSTSTIVRSLRPRGRYFPFCVSVYSREVPRVALGRVAAPVDDEVGPVLHFAQRAGHFTAQLGGDFGGAVSKRCVAVDDAADQFGEPDRLALRLAGGVAETVDERHVRGVQELGRGLDRFVDRRLLAVDEGVGVEAFGGVVLEPRLAEDAGPLRLDDALVVRRAARCRRRRTRRRCRSRS